MLCTCGHDEGDHRTGDGACGRPGCVETVRCPVFELADYRTVWSQPALILTACQGCGACVFPFMCLLHDKVCPGRTP